MSWLIDVGTLVTAIIGLASAAVRVVELVSDITPTTADDAFASKARRALGVAVKVVDRVALNPPASKAREG